MRAAEQAAHKARDLRYKAREAAGKAGGDKDLTAKGTSGQAKAAIQKGETVWILAAGQGKS